ncbi:hypothetical protein Brms1b_003724 [Colletotrichum noveboracense]|nr:hypothetical protein Brms1b_003724 [Colletotrichum noveboracense]
MANLNVTGGSEMYTAADAFFEALWDAGVTHCFCNFGSDHPGVLEAMVKGQRERRDAFPRIITCPSEARIPQPQQPESLGILMTADVILVLDCDVPWIPTRCKPRTDACVIHVDVDPLKHNMPVFYINAQHRYQANAFVAVTQINDYIASNDEILSVITSPLYAMRPLGLQEAHANRMIRIAGEAKPSTEGFFGTPNLMDQLQEAVPKNTIFVVEAITNTQSVAEQLRLTTPGS